MPEDGRPAQNGIRAWRYSLVGGLVSLPFTLASYWQTGSELSLAPVALGGLLAGYTATRKTGESSGVGVRSGLIGGLPLVWMLFDALTATNELAGPPWFVTTATLFTIVFITLGFGFSAAVGEGGARIGHWIARKRSDRYSNARR